MVSNTIKKKRDRLKRKYSENWGNFLISPKKKFSSFFSGNSSSQLNSLSLNFDLEVQGNVRLRQQLLSKHDKSLLSIKRLTDYGSFSTDTDIKYILITTTGDESK
jgi:hypothetical protein